jgi:hypothetical protein
MLASTTAADEPLSRTAIAKNTKAATALVEIDHRYGSAFCVHPSGLFVTNAHMLEQPGVGAVSPKLVLNAGTKTQKVLPAKLRRRDKELDLALLSVDGQSNLQALSLGSEDDLSELSEAIAFGFPFGTALNEPALANSPLRNRAKSASSSKYPAISVNAGSITSLRRDADGKLLRIQMDVTLNPGNSGGPVVDRQGKVIGVVVSGIPGTGINMAIPVSHLRSFLDRLEILFTPPVLNAANQHQEVEFQATTVSIIPAEKQTELALVLSGPGPERSHPMQRAGNVYRVKAVPFLRKPGPAVFKAEVKYSDGVVGGNVEERSIDVGGEKVSLAAVARLSFGSRPEAELNDGRLLQGKVSGLAVLPLRVGGQTLSVNTAQAIEISLDAPGAMNVVSCKIVARQAGKEVGAVSMPLYVGGARFPSLDALRDDRFLKPPRSPAPITYLRAVSSPGDFIGQGKTYYYENDELAVQLMGRGVQITVGGFAGWRILFGAPPGQSLQAGEYLDAKRHPFAGDSPGIEFTGFGRGCNEISGKFRVWEFEMKGTEISRLAIDFIQRCEKNKPPLYGSIRFKSTYY